MTGNKDLEDLLEDLRELRRDARKLTRSGHPGVRAQALKELARAERDIQWLKARQREER